VPERASVRHNPNALRSPPPDVFRRLQGRR
jgi:hypothetical protein